MAAKVIERFWSAVRGGFAGLVGRRMDGSEDGVTVAVGDDGDIHPFLSNGDNGQVGALSRCRTQAAGQYGAATPLTDSGQLYAGACRLLGLLITTTTVATAAGSIKDGGTGGTVKAPLFLNALGTHYLAVPGGPAHGTDVYFTKGTDWAGSIQAVVDAAV